MKIGKASIQLLLVLLAVSPLSAMAEAEFTATLDRDQLSQDESIVLKLTVTSDGSFRSDNLVFSAPDFEEVNRYSQNSRSSQLINGQLSSTVSQTLNVVLHPLKQGPLKITGISVQVDGATLKAAPLEVQVVAAGAGSPQARVYGQGTQGGGLRGGRAGTGTPVFMKAELNKSHVFKGEQVIVSYYLYSRTRILSVNPDRGPAFKDFIKDELEMPLYQNLRASCERVVFGGAPYERCLLLRYALYPLKTGKLSIDRLSLKFQYYAQNLQDDDGEDFSINSFFQRMAPRESILKSEPVDLQVDPLPTDGKPIAFTGGVGDFQVTTASDKNQVKTNEAINFVVKVEGRGNVSAIGEPRVAWPSGVEVYDTKSKSKTGRAGVGEKVFEYVLIPRQPGTLQIPSIEFAFFDPVKRAYYTRKTEPLNLQVTGEATVPIKDATSPSGAQPAAPHASESGAQPATNEPAPLNSLDDALTGKVSRLSRVLGTVSSLAWILGAVGLAGVLAWWVWRALRQRKGRRVQAGAGGSKALRERVARVRFPTDATVEDLERAYEKLSGAIFEALDAKYQISSRALARRDLAQILIDEKGIRSDLWDSASKVLEFAEDFRFASRSGAVTVDQARSTFARWREETLRVIDGLDGGSAKK